MSYKNRKGYEKQFPPQSFSLHAYVFSLAMAELSLQLSHQGPRQP